MDTIPSSIERVDIIFNNKPMFARPNWSVEFELERRFNLISSNLCFKVFMDTIMCQYKGSIVHTEQYSFEIVDDKKNIATIPVYVRHYRISPEQDFMVLSCYRIGMNIDTFLGDFLNANYNLSFTHNFIERFERKTYISKEKFEYSVMKYVDMLVYGNFYTMLHELPMVNPSDDIFKELAQAASKNSLAKFATDADVRANLNKAMVDAL